MKEENGILIDKRKMKKVVVAGAVATSLVTVAITGAVGVARNKIQRYQGAKYITQRVVESGILPEMSVRDDSIAGDIYTYQDASGVHQRVIDVDSFFNDIAAECDDYGINVNQFAIAVEFQYDYDANKIQGATAEGMKLEEMSAYYEAQLVEQSRRSSR